MIYCEGKYCSRRDQCAYHEDFDWKYPRQCLDESTEGCSYGGFTSDGSGKYYTFHHEYYCGDRAECYHCYKALGWREGEEYKNSKGCYYDEVCVTCEHLGLCFKLLENAGSVTRCGERVMWCCEEIKRDPEQYKEILRRNGWKEIK